MKSSEFGLALGLTVAAVTFVGTEWAHGFDPAQQQMDQVNACSPYWPANAGKYQDYPSPCDQTQFQDKYPYDFTAKGYVLPSREDFIKDNTPPQSFNVHKLEEYGAVSGASGTVMGLWGALFGKIVLNMGGNSGGSATNPAEESMPADESKRRKKRPNEGGNTWDEELEEELKESLFDSPPSAEPAPKFTTRQRYFGKLATWFRHPEITREMALDNKPVRQIELAVKAMKTRKFETQYPPQD